MLNGNIDEPAVLVLKSTNSSNSLAKYCTRNVFHWRAYTLSVCCVIEAIHKETKSDIREGKLLCYDIDISAARDAEKVLAKVDRAEKYHLRSRELVPQ